jgi:hypothetical protein
MVVENTMKIGNEIVRNVAIIWPNYVVTVFKNKICTVGVVDLALCAQIPSPT